MNIKPAEWIILAVLIGGLTGLCHYTLKTANQKSIQAAARSVRTITHDGHKFIVEDHLQKGGLIHHPDCPCTKKP